MAIVYILQNKRDGRFYIGSTVNLTKRLQHHAGGFTYSTSRFGGCVLVFSQKYPTLEQARYIEQRLKKLKRKDYLEKIVREGYITMESLRG